jgi:hypothetical protein
VIALLAVVFLWPLPHVVSAQMTENPERNSEATIGLPVATQVTVQWHTQDGATVAFQVDPPEGQGNGVECYSQPVVAGTCSFLTPIGGTYIIQAGPGAGEAAVPHVVDYTFSYYAPLV